MAAFQCALGCAPPAVGPFYIIGSISKRLRIYFLFDRKLLAKLSICAWKVIKRYLQSSMADNDAVPGASIAVQTYGDFLNFNPHLHAIVSNGCFSKDGDFHMAPGFMLKNLEELFQYEVFKMLKKEGKITDAVIENMLSWRHSSFHVYIGDRIFSDDQTGLGNLARYIIRACFSADASLRARKSMRWTRSVPSAKARCVSSALSRNST